MHIRFYSNSSLLLKKSIHSRGTPFRYPTPKFLIPIRSHWYPSLAIIVQKATALGHPAAVRFALWIPSQKFSHWRQPASAAVLMSWNKGASSRASLRWANKTSQVEHGESKAGGAAMKSEIIVVGPWCLYFTLEEISIDLHVQEVADHENGTWKYTDVGWLVWALHTLTYRLTTRTSLQHHKSNEIRFERRSTAYQEQAWFCFLENGAGCCWILHAWQNCSGGLLEGTVSRHSSWWVWSQSNKHHVPPPRKSWLTESNIAWKWHPLFLRASQAYGREWADKCLPCRISQLNLP